MLGLPGVGGDQLGDHVQPLGIQVTGDVAVVAADVVLLRRLAFEQAARLEEELLDPDIGGQAAAVQIGQELQLGIVAEDPRHERLEEALLQRLPGTRARQTQCGVDGQLALGHLPHPRIECIDPAIGLAQPQRQAEMDGAIDRVQYTVDGLLEGTAVRHLALLTTSMANAAWTLSSPAWLHRAGRNEKTALKAVFSWKKRVLQTGHLLDRSTQLVVRAVGAGALRRHGVDAGNGLG